MNMAIAPSMNVRGANERLTVGLVGAGHCCYSLLGRDLLLSGETAKVCNVVGVADASKYCREDAVARYRSPDCAAYADYRKLLEDRSIDAIVCAVEDHQHAPVILDSLRAGKHVYVLPPLCRFFGEALEIWDTCKSTGPTGSKASAACSGPTAGLNWLCVPKL